MTGPAGRPLRLLLVDDDAQWRAAARSLLVHQRAGEVVGEAADARTALDLVRRLRPDVVLLDLHLPEVDGNELAQRLRLARPAIRVLVLTSSSAASDVRRVLAAGAAGYAVKTEVVGCLGDVVRRVADGEVVLVGVPDPAPAPDPAAAAARHAPRAARPPSAGPAPPRAPRGRLLATTVTGGLLAGSLVAVAALAGLAAGGPGALGLPALRSAQLALQQLEQALLPLDPAYLEEVLGERFARPAAAGGTPTAGAGSRPAPAVASTPDTRGPARSARGASDGEVTLDGAPNDDRRNAVEVESLPTTVRLDDRAATREPDEPSACSATGGTTWYAYRAAEPTTLLVDTVGSDHPTAVAVFTGEPSGGAQPAGCGTDVGGRAATTVPLAAGQRVLVQVTSPLGGGSLVVRLSAVGATRMLAPPPDSPGRFFGSDAVVSGDGNVVAWTAAPDDERDCRVAGSFDCPGLVLVQDLRTGRTEVVVPTTAGPTSQRGGRRPTLSYDGSLVGFTSTFPLVRTDTDGSEDYYVVDRRTGTVHHASVGSAGEEGTAPPFTDGLHGVFGEISSDGRYAVFASHADGLVPGDRDGDVDVFRHDLRTRRTELLSAVPRQAGHLFPQVSADGRTVLFVSDDDVQFEAFLWEEGRGIRQPLRTMDGRVDRNVTRMDLSADGRWAAWVSSSPDVVPGDTNGLSDVFLTDLLTGHTRRVSVASDGSQASGGSLARADLFQLRQTVRYVAVSADGSRVAFDSPAPNLVAGDGNGSIDVFVHEVRSRTTRRVSVTTGGAEAGGASAHPSLSHDGRVVAFESEAKLDARDADSTEDAYVHDERSGG